MESNDGVVSNASNHVKCGNSWFLIVVNSRVFKVKGSEKIPLIDSRDMAFN